MRDDFVTDIVNKAWNKARISEGERRTDDQIKILLEEIAIHLTPYITGNQLTI